MNHKHVSYLEWQWVIHDEDALWSRFEIPFSRLGGQINPSKNVSQKTPRIPRKSMTCALCKVIHGRGLVVIGIKASPLMMPNEGQEAGTATQ